MRINAWVPAVCVLAPFIVAALVGAGVGLWCRSQRPSADDIFEHWIDVERSRWEEDRLTDYEAYHAMKAGGVGRWRR